MADPYPQPIDTEHGDSSSMPSSSHIPSAAFAMAATEDNSGPEDVEMKAIMATLTNAKKASSVVVVSKTKTAEPPPNKQAEASNNLKPPVPLQVANNSSSTSMEVDQEVKPKSGDNDSSKQEALTEDKDAQEKYSSPKPKLKKRLSSSIAFDNSVDTSEDDDIPVAVPVEGGDNGDGAAAVVATIVNEDENAAADGNKTTKKLKLLNSEASAASGTTTKKRRRRKSTTPGGAGPGRKPQGSAYRSAAAAHRNRQIHVPPIGSPGLLMLPTLANTAAFPPIESEEEARKKWLVKPGGDAGGDDEGQEYLLPSTVFRQSMIAGGYTIEKRLEKPHRGSSTERTVGDMFDSDAGGLYLHFPELIPLSVWERRLGDKMDYSHLEPPPKKEVSPDKIKRESSVDAKKEGHKGPKGARSSYIFFTNAQRKLMVTQFPGMRFTEQGVIMGQRWRALTPEEKKPYEDMAINDKERYSREMKEYIDSVKKEIKDEKAAGKKEEPAKEEEVEQKESPVKDGNGGQKDVQPKEGQKVKEEPKEGGSEVRQAEETKKKDKPRKESEIKGPRLVDAMILSLSKMLGEKVHRKQMPPEPEPEPVSSSEVKPDPVPSSSDTAAATADPPRPRRVSPDLTLDELPRFTPPSSQPQTLKRCRTHEPMSFLDMIPISLTSTYPSDYVARRRAYAKAVLAREDATIDAQEAKDDADDAQEKFQSHTEAWEKMLEYQKNMIAKREAERKRQREKDEKKAAAEKKEAAEKAREVDEIKIEDVAAAEKKSEDGTAAEGSEAGKNKKGTAEDDSTKDGGNSSTPEEKPATKDDAVKESSVENGGNRTPEEKKASDNAAENGNGSTSTATEEKKKPRPPTPPPEDPMECMPPRPKLPCPARVVSVPDIPIPPSPPPVAEIDVNADDDKAGNDQQVEMNNLTMSKPTPPPPPNFPWYLDPSCFLPSGRYHGLLSNHISDPQFCGVLAPGIAGNTFGGGTGLATSYAGGGRGAAGLVGGPSRGGNLWQTLAGAGSKSSEKADRKGSSKERVDKKVDNPEKKAEKKVDKPEKKVEKAEKKVEKPDEVILSKAQPDEVTSSKAQPDKVTSSKAQPDEATSSKAQLDEVTSSKAPAASVAVLTPVSSEDAKAAKDDSSPSTPAPAEKKRASSPSIITSSTEKDPKKKKQKRATAFGLATGDRNTSATEVASGSAGSEFPEGWTIKTYRRSGGETIGKTDRFWFSPGRNIRFRAKKHAKAFVEILNEPKVEGDEDKAAEIYRARGLHF